MSSYDEDDFENINDDFNDRDMKTINVDTKIKKSSPDGRKDSKKDISYQGKYDTKNSNQDTLARDATLGIKPKTIKKPKTKISGINESPGIPKSKPGLPISKSKLPDTNPSQKAKAVGLSKQGGIYSSTPNLKGSRRTNKRSLLGGEKLATSRQVIKSFGLTKKAEQSTIPSKAMILEKAEKLIEDAKTKIDTYRIEKEKAEVGNIDERLEVAIKENKYLQKTLIDMQDVINKVFEKYDPLKAPMRSYPQTERIKSPPKSVKMKYRTKEVENAQHALDNMMVEYERVHARMEAIKDPNFFSNLHAQLEEINREMKDLEIENKSLQTEQKKREIEMEKLISQGAPDTMFQINDLQNKVTISKDKLRKEQAENEEVDTLMKQVLEQEKALKEKEAKLKEIGVEYGINFDQQTDEKKQIEAEKLQEKRDTYDKHLAIAESATKAMKRKLKTTSKQNKTRLKELELQKLTYEKELELKSEEVKAKNKEIAELMERNSKLLKRQTKDTSNAFIAEKNDNGYDNVRKAIEEQNEKEVKAAIIIQAWCRMILAIRFVNKLRQEKNAKDTASAKVKPKKVDSSTDYEKVVDRRQSIKNVSDNQYSRHEKKNSGYKNDVTPRQVDESKDYEPESKIQRIDKSDNDDKDKTVSKRQSKYHTNQASTSNNHIDNAYSKQPSIKNITSKPSFGHQKKDSSVFKQEDAVESPYEPERDQNDFKQYEDDQPVEDKKL